MKLKQYQKASLTTLRKYLEEARIVGPSEAYTALTAEPELAKRLKGFASKYKPLKSSPDVPYVCLRLPTGGGKTILAAHSITVAKEAWIEKDYPMVLWLVPTNTIRTQTAEALKNPRHPYRQVLDEAFEGRVRIFDIGDFTQITTQDLSSNLCVVVGTIQTLRVTNTDGRKVYAHNENLESHFSSVSANTAGLEPIDNDSRGGFRFSFANLMHLHRPLVIMDEAHKAGSDLSQEVYERINPSACIEYTATPKGFNNILHTVSAQELKDEEMIKMPVVLDEAETWQGAVNSAIFKRAELQEYADRDRDDYIRPIVLFQAEKKGGEATVEVLKQHLIENENIDEHKIAVATGSQRELDGIDLFKPDCPIEYVITIEALKEGWDCSFAYVFCSLANIRSSTDAEQLLGRVLRMPYATKRKEAALNKSYAKLVSKHFSEAAMTLRDKLVDMGFDESEAEDNIEAEQPGFDDGLFGKPERRRPTMSVEVKATPQEQRELQSIAPGKIKVSAGENGNATIEFYGVPKPREEQALIEKAPTNMHEVLRAKLKEFKEQHPNELAPAHLGEEFIVPRLMTNIQGELVFGDTDILMEYHDWSLNDYPARLSAKEFDIVETTNAFEIDLDGNRLTVSVSDASSQLSLDIAVEDWTPNSLVRWLDSRIRDQWIGQAELLAWLSDIVENLTQERGIPLSQLMRCKFILARKLKQKIQSFRLLEREKVYQSNLFGPTARIEVSFDEGFRFFDDMYYDVPKYRGGQFKYKKHFMGPDEVPSFDSKDGGEEHMCALALDALPGLKYWTRNVARHRNSFSLPTSTDKFYPDFVALMDDGRLLVVEYKGKDRSADESRDSREKNLIGQQWAKASNGRAVFVMATMEKGDPKEVRAQVLAALGMS
ncbi:restriction endonuclease subunit R [Pseudidiomarina gelatinasegens]|uniref:Restriction endonuclease subunit R n=1 Tax=Pseudidiomarina gelatinasegens TaxID=2487740 RepID=A0A443YYP5_9GAMM|nr:DEAD/DEAH box helicase family protein [Pseudidiomarina gelatinasegens]RWU09214.1 restriction endonuclease subunit R [Pseudidiomarina gelatinasegens]